MAFIALCFDVPADQGVGGLIVHLYAKFVRFPSGQVMAKAALRIFIDKLAAVFVLVTTLTVFLPSVVILTAGVGVSDVEWNTGQLGTMAIRASHLMVRGDQSESGLGMLEFG